MDIEDSQGAVSDHLAHQMRALLRGRREAAPLARVQIADRLAELARELQDQELLTTVTAGVLQRELAEQLEVSQQAVSLRVKQARARQQDRAVEART